MAAALDLENITDYLLEKTPGNAARLVRKLYEAPSALKAFPNRGRPGRKRGDTRVGGPIFVLHRYLSSHLSWRVYRPNSTRRAEMALGAATMIQRKTSGASFMTPLDLAWPHRVKRFIDRNA